MSQWKKVKLSDLGEIVGGATPSTKRDDYYNGDIAWLTPKDLSGYNSRFISRGERNITKAGLDSCSAKLIPKHSILFTSRAPIGYIGITENDVCTNQGFKSIVPYETTDYRFLYYLLKYNKEKIESMGSGTTFKEVSGTVMKNIEVSAPTDICEQKAIADILSAFDDKIELNNKINDNLEQQAQILFKRLIIDESIDQPIGILSDIAYINPQRTLKKGKDAVYVEMSNLPTHGSFPSDWEVRTYSGGMKFINGDTIMARITPCLENGKIAYINFLADGETGYGSTEYIVMAPREGYCSEMLYFLARYPDFVDYAVQNMNGSSGRQRVSGETICKYEMHIPTSQNVKKFALFTSLIMETIRLNSFENRNISKVRNLLISKLMSGEIRVPLGVI